MVHLTVNGKGYDLNVPPSRRLVDVLRHDLQLAGTKVSCEIGRCGSCIVLLDGMPVNSCLTMVYQCEGKPIVTVEGLATDRNLNPVQQAFLEEGGFQCGYCTAGMVISASAFLSDNPSPSADEVLDALSGNLCRCTGYHSILRAMESACRKTAATQASASETIV